VITLNRRQARHIQIPTAHRRPAGITLKGVEAEEVAAAAAVAEEVPGIKIVVPVAAMGATKVDYLSFEVDNDIGMVSNIF
jgi:pyruvate/2-oxoglutarate/acetoin dehydrogenase E1 component